MRYYDISSQLDYHAAATQYVIETYGEQVALQFPDVADTVWSCILAGCPEAQTHSEVYIAHRVQPISRRENNESNLS